MRQQMNSWEQAFAAFEESSTRRFLSGTDLQHCRLGLRSHSLVVLREHSGLLASPMSVALADAGEVCKRTVGRTLQGTNVDNLFGTVVIEVGDFVTLLQLVPCSVSVEVVEWMVVWSFVH